MAVIALPVGGPTPISSGMTVLNEATASSAVTAGQFVYSSGSNQVAPADATTNNTVVGIAVFSAAINDPCYYASTDGTEFSGFVGLTKGEHYVLSSTVGQLELVADLTGGDGISFCAIAKSTTEIRLDINNTGLTA